jgi:ABC-type branched-subunit amino acid transport system ATPase component
MTQTHPLDLQVRNVTAGYNGNAILHDVDLSADAEQGTVTIIGPNGAGKSTLLKTIMGFLIPSEGSISFNGQDITGLRPEERIHKGIAYVPQLEHVFASLTVLENLKMGGYTVPAKQLNERIEAVFEQFPRLWERMDQRAETLSGGERQMLAMARALMTDPSLILFDEPSAALSPKMAEQVFQKIEDIRSQGKVIVIVEQDAQRALQISDLGYVLADGHNAFEGPATSILGDDKIREAYLGSSVEQ